MLIACLDREKAIAEHFDRISAGREAVTMTRELSKDGRR